MFGETRLTGCLTTHGHRSAEDILGHISECQKHFSGSTRLSDDLTVVILEVAG
jgi:serine phosphatase RsbU (regulator of sigma subunit)